MRGFLVVVFTAILLGVQASPLLDENKLEELLKALSAKDAKHGPGHGRHEGPDRAPEGEGHEGPDRAPEGEGHGKGPPHHDWEQEIKEKCNIDINAAFTSGKKVSIDEVKEAFKGLADHAMSMAGDFHKHTADVDALEAYLESPDATDAESITKHGELINQLSKTADKVGESALCAYGNMVPLRLRISLYGTEGFSTNSACTTFGGSILKLLVAHNWSFRAAADAITGDFLKSLSRNLRDDVRCLIAEVKEFSQTVSGLTSISPEWNLRQVSVAIDGVGVYSQGLAAELQGLIDGSSGLEFLMYMKQNPNVSDMDVPHDKMASHTLLSKTTTSAKDIKARLQKLLTALNVFKHAK